MGVVGVVECGGRVWDGREVGRCKDGSGGPGGGGWRPGCGHRISEVVLVDVAKHRPAKTTEDKWRGERKKGE